MQSWFRASDLWFPLLVVAGSSYVAASSEELRCDPVRSDEQKRQFWRDPRLLAGAAAGIAAPFLPGRVGEFSLLSALGLLGSYVATETIRLRAPSHTQILDAPADSLQGYTIGA